MHKQNFFLLHPTDVIPQRGINVNEQKHKEVLLHLQKHTPYRDKYVKY